MANLPYTYAVKSAQSKNSMCKGNLEKEINKIERQQLQKMRDLRAEAAQFREHLIQRSGSPSRPNSAQPGMPRRGSRLGSASPGRGKDGSPSPTRRGSSAFSRRPSASPCDADLRSASHGEALGKSPTRRGEETATTGKSSTNSTAASPESRRRSSVAPKQNQHQVFVMQHGSNELHKVTVANNRDQPPADGVPQIVISEIVTDQKPGGSRQVTIAGPNLARRGSLGGGGSPFGSPRGSPFGSPRGSPQGSRRGSDSGSDSGALSQSLNLPIRRERSNSMPHVVLPPIHDAPARRPSYCPEPSSSSDTLGVMDSPPSRSLSFSGIVPARRRGSICERWGSESERSKPRGAERRGSIGIEQMVRDLMYGVQHRELMDYDGRNSATDKQWKDLRKCRYLRIPSRENSDNEEEEEEEEGNLPTVPLVMPAMKLS